MIEDELLSFRRRTMAMPFILMTVAIDVLAFGIIIPVLPHLIVKLIGGSVAKAAVWSSGFGAIFLLMQFVCSPIQGALSDRFGRRTVILLSSIGLGTDFVVMAVAPAVWMLLIGRVASGIFAASFSTANTYITDIIPQERRTAAFGVLGGAFAVGSIGGPAIGGFLGHIWIRLPFWSAAGLSLVNFAYGLFVLPESLPEEMRSVRFNWRHANPLGSLILLRRHPSVLRLSAVFFLLTLTQFSVNSTYVLYTDYRYTWGPKIVGYTLAIGGLCSGLVQTVLVPLWMPYLGERRMILVGVGFLVVSFILFGLAPAAWIFLSGIGFLSLGNLAWPPAKAMITRYVGPNEQGRLQGALTSLQSLAGILGSLVFANVFALSISNNAPIPRLPGAAFLLAAILSSVALFLTVRATRRVPKQHSNAKLTAS